MLLKRKRSEDELSCFSSGGRGYASPMRSESGDVVMMDTDSQSPISPHHAALSPSMQGRSRSCTPSHLPSRTFKRLRNGRPSDEEVHQNTLKILYQAQHQPQQPRHVFSPPATPVSMPTMPPPQTPAVPAAAAAAAAATTTATAVQKQPSLHSFWKIPSAQLSHSPSPLAASASPAPFGPSIEMGSRPTACEDCGVGLSEEDAMMDDGYGFETYINTCSSCSRAVCFSCSVSNLGEQRRCLLCAGSNSAGSEKNKKWVGGIGWSSGGVTVC